MDIIIKNIYSLNLIKFHDFLIIPKFYSFIIMLRRFFNTLVDTQSLPLSPDFLPGPRSPIHATFKNAELESLNWLHSAAPCFTVKAKNISILSEPKDFYNALISLCQNAKRRITLASLYLGTGKMEQHLVATILNSLNASNGSLKINILLDFTRGTRGEVNSKSLVLPLIRSNEQSCKLSLYHTPALRGLTKKFAPPRWNELMGLQHMKLYLIDNTVIISGANLSHDYFTNRQDRYIMIEDARLANFYADFISEVQEFSLQVDGNDCIRLHSGWDQLPYRGVQQDFVDDASEKITNFYRSTMRQHNYDEDGDTWVFPLTEMGQLGIHHDSMVTRALLSQATANCKINLATGYFNLTEDYMYTLTEVCKADCTIMMAHPKANGFQGASGPAGGIPAAYSLLAQQFYRRILKAQQEHRVRLMEYQRPEWSYHAKGLWYYLPNSDLPNLTLIGSSNFGERSVHRDLETQLCLVTVNENLQRQLQSELDALQKRSSQAEQDLQDRIVPKWVHAAVWLFKHYF